MKNQLFNFILVLLGATVAVACGQTGSSATNDKASDPIVIINSNAAEDIALVQAYQKAVFAGDFDKAAEYLHDSLVVSGPQYQSLKNKAEELKAWQAILENQKSIELVNPVFASIEVIPEIPTQGVWVFSWGDYKAHDLKYDGEFTFAYHIAYKIVSGKIGVMGVYYNQMDYLSQLGFDISPPNQ